MENSRSVEELLNLKDYKRSCKICKQADDYIQLKSQKSTNKKFNFFHKAPESSID